MSVALHDRYYVPFSVFSEDDWYQDAVQDEQPVPPSEPQAKSLILLGRGDASTSCLLVLRDYVEEEQSVFNVSHSNYLHTIPLRWPWRWGDCTVHSQLDWLEENYQDLLRLYEGKWVLVHNFNIRFVADSFESVSIKSDELGIRCPFITRIRRWE